VIVLFNRGTGTGGMRRGEVFAEVQMASRVLLLAGIAGIAGSAYALRDQIGPWLPQPLAAVVSNALSPGSGGTSAGPASEARAAQAKGANAPAAKGGGGAPVTVATAQIADMPIILAAPGTVEPMAFVAVKPRVDGQVVEIGVKEGDLVQEGALLYRLDDRLVRAQIKQVEAQVTRDEASLKDAMSISERRDTLLLKKYASEQSAETARQNVEVLKATIAASQASLEMQRTQLDYLTIRAPLTGRTGSITAKIGAFVRSADPTPLLTINQTKPIVVAFALPQVNLDAVKTALGKKAKARILVLQQVGTKGDSVEGELSFVDNQIDKTTGTVTAKVLVENADERLWPGQAVNVELTVETKFNVVTVPASAVLPAQQGMIVWVVGADNKVTVRPVVQDRVIGQVSYLASGLKAGDRVVTDGHLRLIPGAGVSVRDGSRPPSKGAPSAGAGGPSKQVVPTSGAGGG
jgi:membrane fusion protein, multidrug efflux system